MVKITYDPDPIPSISDLIIAYNRIVKGIDHEATENANRAYGGIIRAGKGKLVEYIGKQLVRIAWNEIGGDLKRLTFHKDPVTIPIKDEYIENIQIEPVKKELTENKVSYNYKIRTDIHVSIDNNFVIGIECKSYTENAMLKRILVDFSLLRIVHPDLICVLLQMESQLGGDYSDLKKSIKLGSKPTRTLLSYYDYDLHIITLLEGERKVDKPIHKNKYFKKLQETGLRNAIEDIITMMEQFV